MTPRSRSHLSNPSRTPRRRHRNRLHALPAPRAIRNSRSPCDPAAPASVTTPPSTSPTVATSGGADGTGEPFKSVRQVFSRAVGRAGIASGDVTLHTLRHTALSRMIAQASTTTPSWKSPGIRPRGCCRGTHPTEERKVGALSLTWLSTKRAQTPKAAADDSTTASELADLLKDFGGRRVGRPRDLRGAHAALSQLS